MRMTSLISFKVTDDVIKAVSMGLVTRVKKSSFSSRNFSRFTSIFTSMFSSRFSTWCQKRYDCEKGYWTIQNYQLIIDDGLLRAAVSAQSLKRPESRSLKEVQLCWREFDSRSRHKVVGKIAEKILPTPLQCEMLKCEDWEFQKIYDRQ